MKTRHAILLLIIVFSTGIYAQNKLNIYGYFSTRLEKQFETKSSSGVVSDATPAEWTYPFFNLMTQYSINSNAKAFVNLNGSGAGTLDIRNFWGEYYFNDYLTIRLGKIYRRFGLYNEILDAVPTYYGIEPPELFDTDHLLISRTTTLMVYGDIPVSNDILNYSLTTDNGEGGTVKNAVPLGIDLNYKFGGGDYTIGTSAYTSGGNAVPDVGLGDGSPKSGVLPWMDRDNFRVFGGYVELNISHLLFQAEYWEANHNAIRNPGSIITMVNNAGLSNNNLSRFLFDPTKNPAELVDADIRTSANYTIKTWYVKFGYSFATSFGELAPYIQWDYYNNPETIENKTYGGDNEAGAADNGVFNKSTCGIVFRPIPEVAVKLDQSFHFYKGSDSANNLNVYYPEIRLDVSYIFGL